MEGVGVPGWWVLVGSFWEVRQSYNKAMEALGAPRWSIPKKQLGNRVCFGTQRFINGKLNLPYLHCSLLCQMILFRLFLQQVLCGGGEFPTRIWSDLMSVFNVIWYFHARKRKLMVDCLMTFPCLPWQRGAFFQSNFMIKKPRVFASGNMYCLADPGWRYWNSGSPNIIELNVKILLYNWDDFLFGNV